MPPACFPAVHSACKRQTLLARRPRLALTMVHPPSGRGMQILTTTPTMVMFTGGLGTCLLIRPPPQTTDGQGSSFTWA